jgi:hypothetical protein
MKLSRRLFLKYSGYSVPFLCFAGRSGTLQEDEPKHPFLEDWSSPPREFSQAPFWFWNDSLSESEIARQIQDFKNHGIYAFVIHPRAGLPKDIAWMSEKMISYMRFAIEEAVRQEMWVILYDEGMYPSGSSSGQIVAENPALRPRGLFAVDLDNVKAGEVSDGFQINGHGEIALAQGQTLVTIVKRKKNNHRIAIINRPIRPGYALIRGLHFIDKNPARRADHKEVPEEMPPLADILNPEATRSFIKLVYQRYYDEFSMYFGKTIKAIFTDEPSFFGKRPEPGAVPGNAEFIPFVNRWLGEDFEHRLPALWYDDEPESAQIRAKYYQALHARLEESFYEPISTWCKEHNIALTGHPAEPDAIGQLRYFQFPGQDIVWRYIEPDKASALEGSQSTQAKCASSAMIHLGLRRNANEYCGAYGHNFTFREMQWLAKWLIIRGCNLLIPHAFYYSIRGPRIDERPPDVGPNSPWWSDFKPFSDSTRRLCWLNTDSKHVCDVAALGLNDYLPWSSAKILYQNQIDFNYLEVRHLWQDAKITAEGIHLRGMCYKALIVEFDPPESAKPNLAILEQYGRIVRWNEDDREKELLRKLDHLIVRDVILGQKNQDIRIRHVIKQGVHFYLLFNEGQEDCDLKVQISVTGQVYFLDSNNPQVKSLGKDPRIFLHAHQLIVLFIAECK